MDASSSTDLVKKPESSLTKTTWQATGISPGMSQRGLNHLVLNCLVPGLGSMLHQEMRLGSTQLVLALGSIPLFFFAWYAGLLALLSAYVWSIASGVRFIKEDAP